MSNNSKFISNSFNSSVLDLMSCTSDSYPIGPVGLVTDSLIYGSFMCLGDLLIQFTSNQKNNGTALTGGGSCLFPIDLSGTNVPNTFLITGNNQSSSGGSNITTNKITNSGFTYSNVPSGDNGSYLNFLCISPRPEYFKPSVPFITTGSPFIYWNNSSLILTYTNSGTITFTDTSSMSISISLLSGGGGGGGGGSGGTVSGKYVAGGGGGGGMSALVTYTSFNTQINLNTQYTCSVGAGNAAGGTGGTSSGTTSTYTGSKGDDGDASWFGSDSSNPLITSGPGTGGAAGGNPTDRSTPTNGLGGAGGNNTGSANNGVGGGNYGKFIPTTTTTPPTIYYAAGGGGGGGFNNGASGNGGDGNGNYGSGGNGSGGNGSTGNWGTSAVAGIFYIGDNITNSEWGGGGGGGGGGFCNGNGIGSGGGFGGKGASGCIQITLTF